VLSGVMILMGRLLEKPGPALYSTECVEEEFCEAQGPEGCDAWRPPALFCYLLLRAPTE
jgi:hypothetical protein